MNEIKTKYLADFERIWKEKLRDCGFSYELLPAAPHFPEGFEMLQKKAMKNTCCFSRRITWTFMMG